MKPFNLSIANRRLLREVVVIAENNPNSLIGVRGYKFRSICDRTPVYRCDQLGIVLKCPAFILAVRTPLRVRVPTIKLNDFWVVQPIVKKTNTKKAVSLIRQQLGNFHCDLHRFNVGWYDGKPVMFDW